MKYHRLTILLCCFIALFILSGCAENAIHHAVVSGYPEMTKRYESLHPVGQNDARLILYWPEKSFLQGVAVRIFIDGENGAAKTDIGYRTADLFDLPQGIYSINISRSEKKLQLNAKKGETYCYNVTQLKMWANEGEEQMNAPAPVPLEKCISDFSVDDIRCAHKECLVKTVVPKKEKTFKPYNPGLDEDELEKEAKNFNIAPDVSRIYITRRMYTLGMVRVGLDGKPVSKVDSSSFVVYEVTPGEHTVVTAIGGPHNIAQAYRLSAKPGQCHFFHSDTFRFISSQEGHERVEDYDLIDNGFFKQ